MERRYVVNAEIIRSVLENTGADYIELVPHYHIEISPSLLAGDYPKVPLIVEYDHAGN
jgi:hypothetical protein